MFMIAALFLSSLIPLLPHESPLVEHLVPIEITEPESGMDNVDCIYVINLDRRPEKWQRMKSLLDERGLKANRFSAIDGWNIPQAALSKMQGPYETVLSPGSIGCLLSHISVIKDAYERNFDSIWVMEDDLDFKDDFRCLSELIKTLSEIDPGWDVFYTDPDSPYQFSFDRSKTGRMSKRIVNNISKRRIINEDIMTTGFRFGAYSVIFSKKGIKKIYDYFTHTYIWNLHNVEIHFIPGIREYSARRDIVTAYAWDRNSDTHKLLD